MKIVDPGHVYLLDGLDNAAPQLLAFVKRDNPPEKFPGNIGHHAGVQVQEVVRVLLNRFEYLQRQVSCDHNELVINHLKQIFFLLEARAAARHGRVLRGTPDEVLMEPICRKCGHVQCEEPR